jgi:hypothetical protein
MKTGRVLLSRDVQWMGHYYGEEKGVLPHRIVTEIDDDDDEEESDHRNLDQVSDNDIIVAEPANNMEIEN